MSKKEIKMNWYNVNLRQYLKLQDIVNNVKDETEQALSIAEIILGEEVMGLPITEFNKKVKLDLSFMSEPIPEAIPPKNLEVNGRKYTVDCLLGRISTAQYVDFQNHLKSGNTAAVLSVFIIPKGHKYNDGYDMLQVIDDIKSIPIPIVNSISFFFSRQFKEFMRIFQSYLTKEMKGMKLPKELKENLTKVVQNLVDLGLYPLYSNSVK